MDEIATKAVVIGVSIFVTVAILTVIIFEFSEISEVYKNVGETNISFESQFDELDKFRDSNNIFNGLNVRNYFKKYEADTTIDVCILDGGEACNDSVNISILSSKDEYKAYLENTTIGYKIVFEKII